MVTASCDTQQQLDSFDPSLSDKNWSAQLKEQVCFSVSSCAGHNPSTASVTGDWLGETSELNKNNLSQSKHMTFHLEIYCQQREGTNNWWCSFKCAAQNKAVCWQGMTAHSWCLTITSFSRNWKYFLSFPLLHDTRFKPWNDSYRKKY